MPTNIEHILVVSMGGIGNMVMLTPALKGLLVQYPECRMSFLLSPGGAAQIIRNMPRSHEIIEMPSLGRNALAALWRTSGLRPDLCFVATGTNPGKAATLALLAGARVRVGEARGAGRLLYNVKSPFDDTLHEVEANCRLVEALGGSPDRDALTVWSSRADQEVANRFLAEMLPEGTEMLVGIHAGSGAFMAFKRWPADRFIEVCRFVIRKYRAKIVITGGKGETDLCNRIEKVLAGDGINAAGKMSVLETYELIKRCRLFLSNDTGPMHLAAAAKVPVVALFGPTRDTLSAPYGDSHRVVKADLDCRPCYEFKPVRCQEWSCLEAITVEHVCRVLERTIETAP